MQARLTSLIDLTLVIIIIILTVSILIIILCLLYHCRSERSVFPGTRSSYYYKAWMPADNVRGKRRRRSEMTKPSANNSGTNSSSTDTNDNKAGIMSKTANNSASSDTSRNNEITNGGSSSSKKPRRSIKIEGNCLSNMLKEGYAKITDASRLGKRLSSEIWNSFGAIQVPDEFSNLAIQTKTVADGPSTVKICHYFVACGRCFSVFKYDGHAYGTTGLVKHLKNCHGTQRVAGNSGDGANNQASGAGNVSNNNNSTGASSFDASRNMDGHHGALNITNGPISTFTKRKKSRTISLSQPSMKSLVRAIDDLKSEQNELKQKIQEMLNMMSSNCMGHEIQIISNEGDKVDETFRNAS